MKLGCSGSRPHHTTRNMHHPHIDDAALLRAKRWVGTLSPNQKGYWFPPHHFESTTPHLPAPENMVFEQIE